MATSSFVSRTLSSLVLTMIHSIVWMGSTIVVLYYWMGVILTGPFKHKGLKTDLIIKDSRQLKKIPFHLAVILCEEDISYPDLSLLVCWAFSFGIQWVSVYDIKGEMKKSIINLRDSVEDHYMKFEGLQSQRLKIGLINDYSSTDVNTGNNLIVLSGEDGHSCLANLTVKLCSESKMGIIKPMDIDLIKINSLLPGSGIIVEPNLAIICGGTHSLIGYPPWWTRLTEIMWLSSHYKLSYQQFLDILIKYAECKQRFGK